MSSETTGVSETETADAAVTKVESRLKTAAKRVLVWFLFGAVFGLMPLFAVALKEVFSPKGFDIDELLKGGELLIVSAVVSAGALGELIAAAARGGMDFFLTILGGFFCLVTFAGDTISYVVASNAPASEVVLASLCCFPLTLLASGLCIGTAAYS